MPRRLGPLASSLLLACTLGPYTDTAGASGSSSTGTSTETSGPTTTAGTTGTTGDTSWLEGCDIVLYGDKDDTASVQAALDGAPDGATICFVGEFLLGPVSASGKSGLTLRSASQEKLKLALDFNSTVPAVLDFQGAGGLELSDMSDLTVDLLDIRDPGSHGVSVKGSTGVKLEDIGVGWAGAPGASGALFGVYVSGSSQVLISKCRVTGASDAGIFAGDSSEVVMRHNHASGNVTGLQVENTERAEIHDNVSEHNALGIFVVDLPNAPSEIGEVLVHDNEIIANDGDNFAPGDILSSNIPGGVGVMVLATDTVEIRHNTIADNPSTGVIVVSFETVALLSPSPVEPVPGYDSYPETIAVHDNTVSGNGLMPADLFAAVFMLDPMTDLAWDGVADAGKDNADGHLSLCIRNNGDADFVDLDALNLGANKSFDLAPHDCAHPPVAPVELPL